MPRFTTGFAYSSFLSQRKCLGPQAEAVYLSDLMVKTTLIQSSPVKAERRVLPFMRAITGPSWSEAFEKRKGLRCSIAVGLLTAREFVPDDPRRFD